MGLLDGEIKKIIGSGFKGLLLKGTLRREVAASVDALGDPVGPSVETYAFEGTRDSFSAFYASTNGIPLTDARILIIADLIVPFTEPRKDDKVFIDGEWFQIRRLVSVDPARATYTLSGFKCGAPS